MRVEAMNKTVCSFTFHKLVVSPTAIAPHADCSGCDVLSGLPVCSMPAASEPGGGDLGSSVPFIVRPCLASVE